MVARGFGRVVVVASIAALAGASYVAAYTASKHAALGLRAARSSTGAASPSTPSAPATSTLT
jgi:NAD(P)-dependent dehydrogenase (short-subunit alcohol dehydrogenase family)